MASHWHVRFTYPELNKSQIRVLENKLKNIDRDLDVFVYPTETNGTWRSPLSEDRKIFVDVVKKMNGEMVVFGPLKCEDTDCTCRQFDDSYGCAFAKSPW